MKCDFLGPRFQSSPGGDHPDIFVCVAGYKFCTLEPSNERTQDGPIQNCATCIKRTFAGEFEDLDPAIRYLVCPHRTAPTRDALHCECGIDRRFYGCEKHGKCLKRLPPGKTAEHFADQLKGVTICANCEIPRQIKPPGDDNSNTENVY